MFFSIIVPVYNVEKYLKECVDSILRQTYTDYELILVDDGSKDSSGDICDEYANQDSRIQVVHKKNGGLSSARNAGTKIAQGEYIVYIDSDDYVMRDDFLQLLYKKSNGADIVLYKHQKFIDGENTLQLCAYSYAGIQDEQSFTEKMEILVKGDAYYGMAWIKSIKRSLIVERGIAFEEGLLGEDMEWYYHVVTAAKTMSVIDEPCIAYRQRVGSITSSTKRKNLTDFIYILEKWSKYVKDEIEDERLQAVLFGSMAKYYSNMFITYNRVNDKSKKQDIKRIKDLSWLLRYAQSKRPKLVAKAYRFLGFRMTTLALKVIDRR